jgi:glycosyltransferase involved in cell wall biosynthesis
MQKKISVIATTYNQSEDLTLYLESLARQTLTEFEVIIADDGSRPDTTAVVQSFQSKAFGKRLVHVWHEDLGYRKCKILNSAIRASTGDYLIFTDSDLILHPCFVEDHLSQAKPNSVFMGRRVDLNPQVSSWVRKNGDQLFTQRFYTQILKSTFLDHPPTRGIKRAFRIVNPVWVRVLNCKKVPDLLGSNFSIDRELLYKVNGFDEEREFYWGEDGDLFVRLRNVGAQISGRKSFAVQYHLWHPLRSPQKDAEENYKKLLENHEYSRCQKGLV